MMQRNGVGCVSVHRWRFPVQDQRPPPSADHRRYVAFEVLDMKKGVKRDLIGVIVFAVAVSIYIAIGFLLAPETPDKPIRPETIEGSLSAIRDTLDQAHDDLDRRRFLDRWMWNGIYLGVACVLVYSGWRGLALTKRTDAKTTEKPEDSYLSGKAVAIIVGVFVLGIGALIAWTILSNN